MVNAVGGGSQPAPVKKAEEKKEEKENKKPESQAPAPSPAPAEKPNAGNAGSQDTNLPKGGLDPKAAFQVSQNLKKKESSSGDSEPETTENAGRSIPEKGSKKLAVRTADVPADGEDAGNVGDDDATPAKKGERKRNSDDDEASVGDKQRPRDAKLTDAQKNVGESLDTLTADRSVRDALREAGDSNHLTRKGVEKLAEADLDDDVWGTVKQRDRRAAQKAAQTLVGKDADEDTAAAFDAALKEDDPDKMTFRDAMKYADDPGSIPSEPKLDYERPETGAVREDFSVDSKDGVYESYDAFLNDVKPRDDQDKAGNGVPMGVTQEDVDARLKKETDPQKRRVLEDVSKQFDNITAKGTGTPDQYISGPEMANWYEDKNDSTGELSEIDQRKEFKGSIETLNDPNARKMMDYLEWRQDHSQAQKDNGRYGENGMSLLADLKPDDPAWTDITKDTKYDKYEDVIPEGERQKYIDAAKTALKYPDQLAEVNGGDGIFEEDDTKKWLEDREQDVDGEIDSSKQQAEGNCWVLTGINSVANDEQGRNIITNSIKPTGDGNYEVRFLGDETNSTYTVTKETLEKNNASQGDLDMEVLNEAARQYYDKNQNGRDIGKGGFEGELEKLLTGKESKTLDDNREALEEVLKNDKNGLTISFAAKPDGDGNATEGFGHAYTVKSIDLEKDEVTYINPWDASQERTMKVDDLLKMNRVTYTDI